MTADILDPYDAFPDVKAVPMAQACAALQEHYARLGQINADLSNSITRENANTMWRMELETIELQLHRSALAYPENEA